MPYYVQFIYITPGWLTVKCFSSFRGDKAEIQNTCQFRNEALMDYLSFMCCFSVCKTRCIFTGIIHFPICLHCHYLSRDVCAENMGEHGSRRGSISQVQHHNFLGQPSSAHDCVVGQREPLCLKIMLVATGTQLPGIFPLISVNNLFPLPILL